MSFPGVQHPEDDMRMNASSLRSCNSRRGQWSGSRDTAAWVGGRMSVVVVRDFFLLSVSYSTTDDGQSSTRITCCSVMNLNPCNVLLSLLNTAAAEFCQYRLLAGNMLSSQADRVCGAGNKAEAMRILHPEHRTV